MSRFKFSDAAHLVSAAGRVALGVLFAGAVAAPASALVQTPGTRKTSDKCAQCVRDSVLKAHEATIYRVDSLKWEIDHRRMSNYEREQRARELALAIRELEEQMAELRSQRLLTPQEARVGGRRAQALVEREPYRGKGYLGVTFDGAMAEIPSPTNERIVRFYQYPRIALVEANSPAERGGVHQGDTVIALNGDDVRARDISFTRLLTPKSVITMRVRRDGDPRDLRITVGEAPEYYVRRLAPTPDVAVPDPGRIAARAQGGASGSGVQVQVFGQQPGTAATTQRVPGGGYVYAYSNEGVAGANVIAVSKDLGDVIGVKSGVFVIRAFHGTPAHTSGLRDGDVVIRADGYNVESVADLRRAMAESDDERLKLVVVRGGKRRDVTLRWY